MSRSNAKPARAIAAAVAAAIACLVVPARAEEISVTQWGASLYGAPFAVAIENGEIGRAHV